MLEKKKKTFQHTVIKWWMLPKVLLKQRTRVWWPKRCFYSKEDVFWWPCTVFQVQKMGEKLQGLQEEKHQLFLQLKKVLHEEEKRRRKEQRCVRKLRVDLPVRDDLQWLICIYLHCSSIFILFICSNRQWYYNTDFSQLSIQYSSALHRTAPAQLARWVLWHFHLFHGFRGWKGFKEWYHLIKIII